MGKTLPSGSLTSPPARWLIGHDDSRQGQDSARPSAFRYRLGSSLYVCSRLLIGCELHRDHVEELVGICLEYD